MKRFEYGRRMPGRSAPAIFWWDVVRYVTGLYLRVAYRFKVRGSEHVPAHGPVLFVSNHQSFLDPAITANAATDRPFRPFARESLFRFKPFGMLIRSFGALPVAGAGSDMAVMRVALSELAAGRCVHVYPEGTRSEDGRMKAFERGVLLLQRRAKVDVVPMGIDGACDAWPKGKSLPGLRGRIEVHIGPAISSARLAELGPEDALALLRGEVDRLRLAARASILERSGGRWPQRSDPNPSGPNGGGPAKAAAPAATTSAPPSPLSPSPVETSPAPESLTSANAVREPSA